MMAVSPLNSSTHNTLTDTLTPQAEARQLATRATRFKRGRNVTR